MATRKRVVLKPEDVATDAEFEEVMKNLTDADVRKMGYPNVKVFHLERELSRITGAWRETKDAALIGKYHKTLNWQVSGVGLKMEL